MSQYSCMRLWFNKLIFSTLKLSCLVNCLNHWTRHNKTTLSGEAVLGNVTSQSQGINSLCLWNMLHRDSLIHRMPRKLVIYKIYKWSRLLSIKLYTLIIYQLLTHLFLYFLFYRRNIWINVDTSVKLITSPVSLSVKSSLEATFLSISLKADVIWCWTELSCLGNMFLGHICLKLRPLGFGHLLCVACW